MIYIFIFVILLVLAFIESQSKMSSLARKNIVFLTCFLFFILGAIRWETGTDWESYQEFFFMSRTSNPSGFEPLFVFLNQVVNSFTNNYTIMLFVLSGIIFIFQYRTYKLLTRLRVGNARLINELINRTGNTTQFPICASLVVLFAISLGNVFFVRSSVAYTICFYGLIKHIVFKKSFIKFCILVLIASLIHRSSIFFLLAYFAYGFKFTNKKRILLVVCTPLLVLLFFKVFANSLISILPTNFARRLQGYLNNANSDSHGMAFSATFIIIRTFINSFFVFISMLILYKKFNRNKIMVGLFNVYTFGVAIHLGIVFIDVGLGRLSGPYLTTQIVLLPYIFKEFNALYNAKTRSLNFVFFTLYSAFRLWSNLNAFPDCYFPYTTFFSK